MRPGRKEKKMTDKEIYGIGEIPPLGKVPKKMHAYVIREDRFGAPTKAFKKEIVDVPDIDDDEALIYVMAAGINYNNVWAALGIPVNVIEARQKSGEKEDFHIGGSDASGIVYKVGRNVKNIKVGDEVVVHCGNWSSKCPVVKSGEDPMFSPTFRIWGYETNYGSFAQFSRVQAHQCVPKPKHLAWEQAAAYMLVGATAYRMLLGWGLNSVRKDDVVLVWGGSGGLGSMGIQIARAKGAVPIAVVSNPDKFEYCMRLGAIGCINRNDFNHWGMLPHWKDKVGYAEWLKGVRMFGKALWDILGERRGPRIVLEHPGESTIPTSMFVCETGGMVVICAGTTGYNATVDLRYLWMRQKRVQGSHFANDEQAHGINQLVIEGFVDPCLAKAYTFDEIPQVHQLMYENRQSPGNMAVLVGAPEFGLGISAEKPCPASQVEAEASRIRKNERENQRIASLGSNEPDTMDVSYTDNTRAGEFAHGGVIGCRRETELAEIAKMLVDNQIHGVVVLDEAEEPIGFVSQTDLVLARQGRTHDELKVLTAEQLMTRGCETCDVDTPLSEAVTKMTRLRIHRLIVVDRSGSRPKATGLLSMTDIVRHIMEI